MVPRDEASRRQATATLVCLVNRVRAHHHLRVVRLSAPLELAALSHSNEMVARKYFAHDGLGGDTAASRARAAGYARPRAVLEALAWCSHATPAYLTTMLLRSTIHRRILLDPRVRDIGVGLVLGAPARGVQGPSSTLALAFGG